MIRRADLGDLKVCVELTIDFFKPFLEDHGIKVEYQDVTNTAVKAIASDQVFVVVREGKVVGLAAYAVVPHPANSKIRIFYETIWCVDSKEKTDALLLLRALEDEARKLKSDMMVMANLSNKNEEQLKRIFTKQGFTFLETHYAKLLGG